MGILAAMVLGGGLGGPGAAVAEPNFNTQHYTDWAGDADGNNIDDRLDEDIAHGGTDDLYIMVHYDRRPTEGDATLVRTAGAEATYVMRNWDDVYAQTLPSAIPAISVLAAVVMVEKVVPVDDALDTAAPTARARSASGVPVEEGIDHRFAVHETLGFRGEGMIIAVVDGGIDNRHESLDDLDDDPSTADPKLLQKTVNGQVVYAGLNAGGLPPTTCVDPQDVSGHGTHVAGIAAGTGGPSGTYRGIAPGARLVDIDVNLDNIQDGGQGTGYPLAFDWIILFNDGLTCYGPPGEDRIDVVTFSKGLLTPVQNNLLSSDPNELLNRMITDIVRRGIVFVAAAGNSGPEAESLLVGAEGAIIVANADDRATIQRVDDRIQGLSGRGPRPEDGDSDTLDELRPDVAAPGTSIRGPRFSTVADYADKTGTSMATPYVAGVAALMLQADPTLRPVDAGSNAAMGNPGAVPIRDILQRTAQAKTAAEGPAPQHAQTGRWDHPWNNAWGYGLVDAYAAVREALQP